MNRILMSLPTGAVLGALLALSMLNPVAATASWKISGSGAVRTGPVKVPPPKVPTAKYFNFTPLEGTCSNVTGKANFSWWIENVPAGATVTLHYLSSNSRYQTDVVKYSGVEPIDVYPRQVDSETFLIVTAKGSDRPLALFNPVCTKK